MKHFVLLGLWVSTVLIGAPDRVCVRNYASKSAVNFCKKGTPMFRYMQHATEPRKDVCVRIYADLHCNTASEFQRVYTPSQEEICVMNYAQEPVANYCESVPQFYDYVNPNPNPRVVKKESEWTIDG